MKNIHEINGDIYELVNNSFGLTCVNCCFYNDTYKCLQSPDCKNGYYVKISNTESQNKRILKYLLTGKRLTSIEALKLFNCLRLSARINNLRKKHTISDSWINTTSGKRIKEYFIEK